LDQLKIASAKTEVKILDASGKPKQVDFNNLASTKLSKEDMEANDHTEDLLFKVTRSATGMSLERKGSSSPIGAKVRPAILLSDNKTTRRYAAREQIPAMEPNALMRYLKLGIVRVRSLSKGSRSSESGAMTPPSFETAAGEQAMDTRP
jgi:hypothetical protein